MSALDQQLRRCRWNPAALAGSAIVACAVFVFMGLSQLDISYVRPEPDPPLLEFHLPPPPPPPKQETPPRETKVSINFNLPATSGPADVPLGFLQVDFGLTPKQLTESSINVADTISSFQTDGLEDLTVYDYKDVTEKPVRTYRPPIALPGKLIGNTKRPFEFIAVFRIAKSGRTSDIHIIDCPFPEAVPALTEWLSGFRYKPARKDGQAVDMLIRVRITYNPSSSASPFSL